MIEGIEPLFPRLRGTDWHVTSTLDDRYNCIAWAAGVTDDWWWPVGSERTFWPDGVPRELTMEAFRAAFASLGFVACTSEQLEPGLRKIALFSNDQLIPKHAARQLATGRWTSKLGKMEDIEHELHDVEGTLYGAVVLIMKREGDQGAQSTP